jgi:EAL domain-containing protein (putative c-di-GMP-specific phosphodiesterase class I)
VSEHDTKEMKVFAGSGWYLEAMVEAGRLERKPIHTLPFRIGRRQGLELTLPADSVSKRHAEIYAKGSGLGLRDLGSKNGTFVNRNPVEDTPVQEGDILHFADFEFRLGRLDEKETAPIGSLERRPTTVATKTRPRHFEIGTRELRELLGEGLVTMVFQPIIHLQTGTVAAYEALGRGLHPALPTDPLDLFRIAGDINAEADLSRLFRRKAVEIARGRADLPTIFLNTHPIELARPLLLESLEELREMDPQLDLALEIHESVLTRPEQIAELRQLLLERNIALAYDDFGAGQARLLELADAPPHYLKFDRRFVTGLDERDDPRKKVLRSLLSLAQDLGVGVKSVAEGVETPAEEVACKELGFTHAQGFHLGRPRSLDEPPRPPLPAAEGRSDPGSQGDLGEVSKKPVKGDTSRPR